MNNIIYIGFFLFTVLIVNWTSGQKATFYYVGLVFLGMVLLRSSKYTINIKTPEMLQ